ncbi:hypothetical protein [Terrihabitans sp. B22-R8]|uniref:hypothetical protein n=1 Tax=Terrihabitans sp. B22-R8 TaxID=3425128 RepID=UPI00403CC132
MMMKLSQFEDALDRYGADMKNWPADMQLEGRQLLFRDPRAVRSLEASLRVQGLLSGAMAAEPLAAPQIGRLTQALERRRARSGGALMAFGGSRGLIAALSLAVLIFGFGGWTGTVMAGPGDRMELAALDMEAAGLVVDP